LTRSKLQPTPGQASHSSSKARGTQRLTPLSKSRHTAPEPQSALSWHSCPQDGGATQVAVQSAVTVQVGAMPEQSSQARGRQRRSPAEVGIHEVPLQQSPAPEHRSMQQLGAVHTASQVSEPTTVQVNPWAVQSSQSVGRQRRSPPVV
jgi:hypothetical protein